MIQMRTTSWFRYVLAAFMVVVFAAGCGSKPATPPAPTPAPGSQPAQPAKPAGPTKVVVALKGDASGLDALKNDDGNMRVATDSIYDGLVTRDGKSLEIKPAMAESWKQVDASTVELKLRKGVKFHNGDPLTVDDVVWSIKRAVSKELNSDLMGFFGTIKDAVKVDDSTVKVITDGADPSILNRLDMLKIMSKKFFDGKDEAFVQTNTMGTGPYILEKWTRGSSVDLKANPDYWGGKPAVDQVVIRPIESDATRLASLQSGEVDLATEIPPRSKDQVPVLKTAPGLEYSLILINRFRGVFANPKIAQAAVMAVDRESMAKKLFEGLADTYPLLPFKPTSVGYNASAKAPAFDPEKAKALLKEAGYNGQTVEIVGENGRFMKDGESTQAVAQMLEAVGFKVKVRMVSFQEWLKILFGRDLSSDLVYLSHSNEIFDADRTYSTYVLTTGSGSKYSDKLDTKVKDARKEADPARRKQMYDEIAATLGEDPGWIPMVNVRNVYGLSKKIDWEPRMDQRILFTEIKAKP